MFSEYMTALGEIHNKQISDITKDFYWKALKPYADEQCEKAFNMAMGGLKFFPKPAELIELIQNDGGRLEDRADVEAGRVLEAVKRHGGYKSIEFDDPVTMAVIQIAFGGWVKLCSELMSDAEKWFLKDFVKYYQAYSRQNIHHSGHLPGRMEIENNDRNGDRRNVVQIGSVLKKISAPN
jgi:hypothetical protein